MLASKQGRGCVRYECSLACRFVDQEGAVPYEPGGRYVAVAAFRIAS